MIVLDPGDSTHSARVIPRVLNVDNTHTFTLYDEDLRTSANITNTAAISGAYILYSFSLTTTEGKSYSLKISDGATVIYRGKVFVTAQTTQNYRINE